jgi:hypothetical protein
MDKMNKKGSGTCKEYQQMLIEIFDDKILLENNHLLSRHVKICTECQSFLQGLTNYNARLNAEPRKDLQPDPRILRNMLAYTKVKHGLNTSRKKTLWSSLRDIFEYRVPVYQALGGLIVMFVLFLYTSKTDILSGNNAVMIDYSAENEGLTSSELYLVDTLVSNNIPKGQNAKEDSVLMSFLVPTM